MALAIGLIDLRTKERLVELNSLRNKCSHNWRHREELRKRLYAMATPPPDVLRGISIPVLFITGGEDTTYPPFLSDALAPLMPNARVEQVPDSEHSVYFQRATVFNGLVDNFLSKVG